MVAALFLVISTKPVSFLSQLGWSSLSSPGTGSTAARLAIWRALAPLIARGPGWVMGLRRSAVAFAGVYPPQLVYYQGRHVLIDRAHNLWLDTTFVSGLIGLVCFLALMGVITVVAWRRLHKRKPGWERWLWSGIAAALIGHLVDLQFSFDVIATGALFWLLLGLAVASAHGLKEEGDPQSALVHLRPRLQLVAALLAIAFLMTQLSARPLAADIICGLAQREGRSLAARVEAAEQALTLWPHFPEYHLQVATLQLAAGNRTAVETALTAAIRLEPDAADVWARTGTLYARLADTATGDYHQAEQAFQRATTLAPTVAAYHTAFGLVLARQDRLSKALSELRKAVSLDATDGMAYEHLGNLYLRQGQFEAADQAWQEATYWQLQQTVERRFVSDQP